MTRDLVVDAAMGVAATAAAVASFAALRDLAEVCGWSPWLSALLPLSVDAVAIAAGRTWLSGTGPARSYARVLTLLALGLSVAGNAVSHALTAYGTRPGLALVVAVSGVPPLALGAVVHLAALGRADLRATCAEISVPAPVPAAGPVPDEPGSLRDKARQHWESARAEGRQLSGSDLDRLLGASDGYGRRLLRSFEAEAVTS